MKDWAGAVFVKPSGSKAAPPIEGTCTAQTADGDGGEKPFPILGTVDSSEFINVPITATNDDEVANPGAPPALRVLPGQAAMGGDVAILVGMHIITKAVPTWTWNTYWWEPADLRGTGFGVGRPVGIPAPYSNYVMNGTIHKAGEPGTRGGLTQPNNPVYNPYQEVLMSNRNLSPDKLPTVFKSFETAGGLASNCLSCHSNAAYPNRAAAGVITYGAKGDASPYNRIPASFLWSLAPEPILTTKRASVAK